MEEQKKKFLLSRIKKQQKLIISEYDNLQRQFLGNILLKQKNEHFLQQATRLMELNTALASNLFQYLQPNQMQAIFQRINTVYYDLVEKFKKTCRELQNIQNGQSLKQIRQVCDICNEKIQINRIQKIKRSIEEQSECRTVLIRKLIEQSQMERVKPIFNEQQDRIFKTELSKVLSKKQMVLQTTINETNIFLTKVETQITDFMLSFTNQFAHWGGEEQQCPNLNWGKTIKGFIDKKLSKSFHQRIPDWIKRMHSILKATHQESKIYSYNKEIQTENYLSQRQINLTNELEAITNILEVKKKELIQLKMQIQTQKKTNFTLKQQMETRYKLYQNQIQQLNKLNLLHSVKSSVVNEGLDQMQNKLKKGKTLGKKKVMKAIKQLNIKSNSQSYNIQQPQPNSLLHKSSIFQQKTSQIKQIPNLNFSQEQSSQVIGSTTMEGFQEKQQDLKLKKYIFNRQMKKKLNLSSQEYEDTSSCHKSEQKIEQTQSQHIDDLKQNRNILNTSLKQHHNKEVVISKNIPIQIKRFSTDNKIKGLQLNTTGVSKEFLINCANILIKRAEGRSNSIQIQKHESQNISSNAIINCKQVFQLLHSMIHSISKCAGLTEQKCKHLISVIQKSFDRIFAQDNQLAKQISVLCKEKQAQTYIKRYNSEVKSPINQNNVKNSNSHFCQNQDISFLRGKNVIQERRLRLPKISNHLVKSYIKMNQLQYQTGENMTLFLNDKMALEYEQSFVIQNDRHSQKPTARQLQKIQSIYAILQSIKVKKNNLYRQICSFIRYPSSAIKNKCTIKELPFSSFCNYFMKIQWYHRQCQIKNQQLFCKHISWFFSKITKIKENADRKVHRSQKKDFESSEVEKLI